MASTGWLPRRSSGPDPGARVHALQIAFLTPLLVAGSCNSSREVPIRREPTPSASVTERVDLSLAAFDLRVPERCNYIQRAASAASVDRFDVATEETVEARVDPDGITFVNVYSERPPAPDKESSSSRTWRLDARGFIQLSQRALHGGNPSEDRDFDPPMVLLPPLLTDGSSWESPYPEKRTARITLRRGSHYCATGVRTESSVALPKGLSKIRRSHFCPKQGWRGDETVYFAGGRVQGWSWTTDLVADGERYQDPPLDVRFPEGSPELGRPTSR